MNRSARRCGVLVVSAALLVATALGVPPPANPIQLPGAGPFDADLQQRLRQAWSAERSQSQPRTTHFNPDGSPKYINRLVFASSPYLQQHAYNPVNWYPWGEEAFAAAQRENKPILLSIGYSTCHWCHVMEQECFEDEAIAQLINEQFIAIKVDREQRPDIDAVYVAAVERMTGSAGWPLTVFLTPDRAPVYGGTYFPPEDRYGKPGLPKLLRTVADAWRTRHDEVLQAGAALSASLGKLAEPGTAVNLSADTLRAASEQLRQSFDPTNGGFGGAPKFPQAHMLQFLLRYWLRSGDTQARHMAEESLDHMARGGIHDQLGGGFHRYSTDTQWLVPHFEKMLYDQAIDARAYLEAYRATGSEADAQAARDIFAYVSRDLGAPEGAFYTAEDADSDGEEGRFYIWSRDEVIAALGQERGSLVADFFAVTNTGPLPGGRSPLSVPMPIDAFAQQRGLDASAFTRTLGDARQDLLAARNRRPRPLRDEKLVTAWNGLMVSSLAYGSIVLGDPQYAAAAARAADFVLNRVQRDGRLLRFFRNQPAPTPGYLDDYAFFILGLNDLYAATFQVRWLQEADRLSRDMVRLFADPVRGMRFSASDHEQLIAAGDDAADAALPSAQSVAALALLQLGRLTMNDAFERQGRALLAANSQEIAKAPTAYAYMLIALDFALGPTKEIVVAGPPGATDTRALLAIIRGRYLPRAVVAVHPPNDGAIESLVPFLRQQRMINGKPTAYVCENYVCKLPTNDPSTLDKLLAGGVFPVATNPSPSALGGGRVDDRPHL